MFPWLLWWSPSFYFPFSGAVSQDIETDWFESEITPESGDSNIERRVFRDVASYGTQIGLLNEAVLALAEELKPEAIEQSNALRRLKELQEQVERVKGRTKNQTRNKAKQMLDKLAQEDPDYLASLLESYSRQIREEVSPLQTNNDKPQVAELS